jgi:hypothetical protein
MHQALDPVIVAAPWLIAGGVAYSVVKRVAGRPCRAEFVHVDWARERQRENLCSAY